MTNVTATYLTTNNGGRVPTKSVSTSTISLLPRPIANLSHHRKTNVPKKSTTTTDKKQRSTTTPQVHRRRTSSTSSLTNNWLTGIFSQPKKTIKSAIRLSFDNNHSDWQIGEDSIRYIGSKHKKKFDFDHVFRGTATNQNMFDTCVKPTIRNVMKGLSGTVFTYGQPGSGKSHTMFGNKKDPGILSFAFDTVFDSIKEDDDHEYILYLSFFEIANEVIRDLLVEQSTGLKIADDNKRRGAYVASLREQVITSSTDALQYIQKGEANRYLLSTNYDSHHSRAHTFIQLTVEKRELYKMSHSSSASVISSASSTTSSSSRKTRVPKIKRRENIQISYLYLIDLASNDKSVYQVLKNPINKSCLALEAIVHNLSETGKSAGHPLPPYHDSKLTRLLQPSFMGQHNVVCICTVDMESAVQDEIPTLETLNFATRIRRIPAAPKICDISEDKSLLVRYTNEISFLSLKLEKLERDNQENRHDLVKIKSVLEQRLYCKSRFILTSKSTLNSVQKYIATAEDDEEDPWKVIDKLRVDFETLAASNSTQFGQLKSVMEETRSLPDEIAQLEAELNITRAELQVTQLLVNERDSSLGLRLK
ncbi:P-loop containing nucleoside triphosphate hydrolase protein [Thamnidium elegans]|nr:P-loop containing nucleoside triphosphate hydrolase protein [Thamnidium elegans]